MAYPSNDFDEFERLALSGAPNSLVNTTTQPSSETNNSNELKRALIIKIPKNVWMQNLNETKSVTTQETLTSPTNNKNTNNNENNPAEPPEDFEEGELPSQSLFDTQITTDSLDFQRVLPEFVEPASHPLVIHDETARSPIRQRSKSPSRSYRPLYPSEQSNESYGYSFYKNNNNSRDSRQHSPVKNNIRKDREYEDNDRDRKRPRHDRYQPPTAHAKYDKHYQDHHSSSSRHYQHNSSQRDDDIASADVSLDGVSSVPDLIPMQSTPTSTQENITGVKPTTHLIIFDTNWVVRYYDYLFALLLPQSKALHVIIPRQIAIELDNCKQRAVKDEKIKFQRAIKWLNKFIVATKDLNRIHHYKTRRQVSTADEEIVEAALHFKRYTSHITVLTEDQGLSLRLLTESIDVASTFVIHVGLKYDDGIKYLSAEKNRDREIVLDKAPDSQ